MADDTSERVSLGTLIPIIAIYYIVLCALYLDGYWYTFKINAFSFISAKEVLTFAPLTYLETIIDCICYALASIFTATYLYNKFSNQNEASNKCSNYFGLLVYVFAISSTIYYYFIYESIDYGTATLALRDHLSLLISPLLLVFPIINTKFWNRLFRNRAISVFVLSFALSLPAVLFYFGKFKAIKIATADLAQSIETNDYDFSNSTENLRLRFIGVLGDRYIFWSHIDNATYYVEQSKIHSLRLKYMDNGNSTINK